MRRLKHIRSLLFPGLAILAGLIVPPVVIAMMEEPESSPSTSVKATPTSSPQQQVQLTARNNDCGAACLYLICRLAGRPESLDVLRRETHITEAGTSLLHLRDAARDLGFETEAIRGDFSILAERIAPKNAFAILHVRGNHFVVAEGIAEDGALRLLDPSREAFLITGKDLRERYRWEGVMLCLTNGSEEGQP